MRPLDEFITNAVEDVANMSDKENRMVTKLANLQVTLFVNLAEALKGELSNQAEAIVDNIIYEVVDKEEV